MAIGPKLGVLGLCLLVGMPLAFALDLQTLEGTPDDWTVHGQLTTVLQGHPPLVSPYEGPNSLYPGSEGRTSLTSTLFLGRRLWNSGAIFVNPEVQAGQGFSHTTGIAGFPNGEIYRVSSPSPEINLARLYFQQIWGFSQKTEVLPTDQNQLPGPVPVKRLTFVGGKFSLVDFFDDNAYSHDPRTQFLNWSLFANGAWDYAADTRGYTYGLYLEYNQPVWAVRAASVMEPREANQESLDPKVIDAHGDEVEVEYRYALGPYAGIVRTLGYMNHAHMGNYAAATSDAALSGASPNIITTRAYSEKYGFGLNLEQAVTADLGFFSRAGWSNGKTETWAFTPIDQTVAAGLSYKGTLWHRPDDRLGSAVAINMLSSEHRAYLAAGGLDFNIGDGRLAYAPEQIWETYYAMQFWKHLTLTPDIQLIKNPAYNADRGPVVVGALRIHLEF